VFSSWNILKEGVVAFINDDALSRGAAISFYTATSLAPVLLIVIAVAGLAVGRHAAQNGVTAQLSGLMGQQTADVLQSAIVSAPSADQAAPTRLSLFEAPMPLTRSGLLFAQLVAYPHPLIRGIASDSQST